MTEDEAKTKWCPFVRMAVGTVAEDGESNVPLVGATPNRFVDRNSGRWSYPKGAACIGSACMAWRDAPLNRQPNVGRAGYCGLSGRPLNR